MPSPVRQASPMRRSSRAGLGEYFSEKVRDSEWLQKLRTRGSSNPPPIKQGGTSATTRFLGEQRAIHIFISSSFVDMQAERDLILKRVLPLVNSQLKSRQITLVPIDLRWGVARGANIVRICLDEIDRCRTGSKNGLPYIIALRSMRNGWIPSDTYSSWDLEDPYTGEWLDFLRQFDLKLSVSSLEVLHAFLGVAKRDAAAIKELKGCKSHAFVYERESGFIEHVDDSMKWVFDFDYISTEEAAGNPYANQYSVVPAGELAHIRSDFKAVCDEITRVQAEGLCAVRKYSCELEGAFYTDKGGDDGKKRFGIGRVKNLRNLEDRMVADLMECFSFEFEPVSDPLFDSLAANTIINASAMVKFAKNFIGRRDELEALRNFATSTVCEGMAKTQSRGDGSVMIVYGDCGSGKSSLLAQFCLEMIASEAPCALTDDECSQCVLTNILNQNKILDRQCSFRSAVRNSSEDLNELLKIDDGESSPLICTASHAELSVFHFGSPESYSVVSGALLRVCQELERRYKLDECIEDLCHVQSWERNLVMVFENAASDAPGEANLVIVIDVNMTLTETGISWLPRVLPPRIKLIVSANVANERQLDLLKSRYEGTKQLDLLCLGVLSKCERAHIVRETLASFKKELCEDAHDEILGDQMGLLLAMEHSHSPLYLTLACERMRMYGVFENLTGYIIKELPGTVRSLFKHVLSMLERENGPEMVEVSLTYLRMSLSGLLELELTELLSRHKWKICDESSAASRESPSVLFASLNPFCSIGPSGVLSFIHEQFGQEVDMRYQLHPGTRRHIEIHRVMAEYFIAAGPLDDEITTPRSVAISLTKRQDVTDQIVFHNLCAGAYAPAVMHLAKKKLEKTSKSPFYVDPVGSAYARCPGTSVGVFRAAVDIHGDMLLTTALILHCAFDGCEEDNLNLITDRIQAKLAGHDPASPNVPQPSTLLQRSPAIKIESTPTLRHFSPRLGAEVSTPPSVPSIAEDSLSDFFLNFPTVSDPSSEVSASSRREFPVPFGSSSVSTSGAARLPSILIDLDTESNLNFNGQTKRGGGAGGRKTLTLDLTVIPPETVRPNIGIPDEIHPTTSIPVGAARRRFSPDATVFAEIEIFTGATPDPNLDEKEHPSSVSPGPKSVEKQPSFWENILFQDQVSTTDTKATQSAADTTSGGERRGEEKIHVHRLVAPLLNSHPSPSSKNQKKISKPLLPKVTVAWDQNYFSILQSCSLASKDSSNVCRLRGFPPTKMRVEIFDESLRGRYGGLAAETILQTVHECILKFNLPTSPSRLMRRLRRGFSFQRKFVGASQARLECDVVSRSKREAAFQRLLLLSPSALSDSDAALLYRWADLTKTEDAFVKQLHYFATKISDDPAQILRLISNAKRNVEKEKVAMRGNSICEAALRGSEGLLYWLNHGGSVRETDQFHRTPLYLSCLRGDTDSVRILLARSADPNFQDMEQKSPLECALLAGYFAVVEQLLTARADPNISFSYSGAETPALIFALLKNNNYTAELMLQRGADPNTFFKSTGETCLHFAVRNSPAVVRVLLNFKADVDAKNNGGETALAVAVKLDATAAAKVLLEARSDPNFSVVSPPNYSHSGSLLQMAVEKLNFEILQSLLLHRADPNLSSVSPVTQGSGSAFLYTLNFPFPSGETKTPLYLSAELALPHYVDALLAANADPNFHSSVLKKTALHLAANGGDLASIRALVEKKCDVDGREEGMRTALHYAAMCDHAEACSLLLHLGADRNAKDCNKKSAIDYALSRRYEAVIAVLLPNSK